MKLGSISSLVAAVGLLAAPTGAAAQDKTLTFKPAGQWAVDYGDDYCRLSRTFSDGKDELALAVERVAPGPFMQIILVSDAIKPFRSAEEMGWHFLPSDAERKARFTRATVADGTPFYNLGAVTLASFAGPPAGPPPPFDRSAEQALAKGMTGFVIETGLSTPVQVDTGPLNQPIAALQACADDLAGTWGLDPARVKTQTAAALPDGGGVGWLPSGTIGFADFPKLAGGGNQVRLMVDATGEPTSCTIQAPTLDKTTNDKICKTLMDKAHFTPAKDADGQAMAGFWMGSPMMFGQPFPGGRR